MSIPEEQTEEDLPDLPGRTIQLRMGWGIEHLQQAEVVEVQNENPQKPEPQGKVSTDDEPTDEALSNEEP